MDYHLFRELVVHADRESIPAWQFGRYVHPSKPRDTLRQSPEGRKHLIQVPSHHEKSSDIAPFVFWDGEGITYEAGMPQSYVLFGSSLGHEVRAHELHTRDCLDLLIQAEQDCPQAIHVGFSFKYDAEMILCDLPVRSWYVLHDKGTVSYQGFRITYHPGRLFRVTRKIRNKWVSASVYDVFGYFQTSFVKSLRTWLDEDELEEIKRIEEGKQARGVFRYEELDSYIVPYWRAELRLGVILMDRLRERLASADIVPSKWYGSGSIATALYKRHNLRLHLSRTTRDTTGDRDKDVATRLPEEVNAAAQCAYFGGRFELFKLGHTDDAVYQYDIRSAYPNGIARLPSLQGSTWERIQRPVFDPTLFAMWHIDYDHTDTGAVFTPGPLPQRDKYGRVAYPSIARGWYWTPEVALVAGSPYVTILEAWVCHHKQSYPFRWVVDLYNERQERKNAGDPSEKAYKLALNSLYGKQAQRIGWQPPDGKLPSYHQLEWAGWVTSYTRMMLFIAMRMAGSSLIATETDAVFTSKPLPKLPVGTQLGEWDMTLHTWLTYLQSGTYWSDHGAKYRGFDADSLSHDRAMGWLRNGNFSAPLVGSTTRFVGSGRGLGSPNHRTWITESRDLSPGNTGKRKHITELCPTCTNGRSAAEYMHPLISAVQGGVSHPHSLPWLDGTSMWNQLQDVESWDHADE